MLILHQWCSITAYGEDAIIKRANIYKLMEFCYALQKVAYGFTPVLTIEDAIDYFGASGKGLVRDIVQPNEIVCDE